MSIVAAVAVPVITQALLSAATQIPKLFQEMKSGSLSEYTKPSRIEPVAYVGRDIRNHQQLKDVLMTLTSMHMGYYCQAVALQNTFNGVRVLETLDRLNPNRSVSDALKRRVTSNENAILQLPNYKSKVQVPALEAFAIEARPEPKGTYTPADAKPKDTGLSIELGKDTIKDMYVIENMAVGKYFEVKFSDGDRTISIPTLIRITAVEIATANVTNIFSVTSRTNSVAERNWRIKIGDLSWMADGWLCDDLITQHVKLSIADKSGMYSDFVEKRRKNRISAVLSNNASLSTTANILIISSDSLKQAEFAIGAKLATEKTRETIMEKTGLQIIVVLDQEWDRVVFYTKGIQYALDMPIHDLKTVNKNSGPDVNEILKAFTMGKAPTF